MAGIKNLADRTAAAIARAATAPASPAAASADRPRMPVSNAGAMLLLEPQIRAAENRAMQAEEKLGQPIMLAVGLLDIVPSRQRKLSKDEYQLLRDNIATNGILEPIKVRPITGDHGTRYEVTSGSNRTTIARDDLGLATVPCVIVADADSEVERKAFYANLLHAPLPDFEKFSGFDAEMKRTGMSQTEMSRSSGVPRATLAELLAFSKLPQPVLSAVESRRHDVSRFTVAEMVKALDAGTSGVALIDLIAATEGVVTPTIIRAIAKTKSPVEPVDVRRLEFKTNKGAKVAFVASATGVRVSGFKEADAARVEEAVRKALEALFGEPS